MLFYLQGDMHVMDTMAYAYAETSQKKAKSGRNRMPIFAKVAVKGNIDDVMKSEANESPKLYLFFDENGTFELAEVAADKCTLHLQAHNVVSALFLYIGCFFVFHVGYNKEDQAILGLLQYFMLGLPYDGEKNKNWEHFLKNYDEAAKKRQESHRYKKRCI